MQANSTPDHRKMNHFFSKWATMCGRYRVGLLSPWVGVSHQTVRTKGAAMAIWIEMAVSVIE